MITLRSHRDLTREAVEAVAWEGQALALDPAVLERVAAGQAELAAVLAAPVGPDRPLGPDLARLVEALERDELPLP